MDVVKDCIEGYLREVSRTVPELAKQRKGTEVLGGVPGRPAAEDQEIGVDRVCEELLENSIRGSGLPVELHSEHGSRRIGSGTPRYLVSADPFDGSGLFRRGLPAEWWSVVTFYDPHASPVAGGALDILRKEMYLADGEGVTLVSLEDEARTLLYPSRKTTLDDDTVIAAYLMDPSYLLEWVDRTRSLLHRFTGVRLWPNGGSCIYPWIARGLVHAYVMFNEPRSEIDPGLAFAWAGGYPTYAVQPDGSLEPYRFIPGVQPERVPFFVAACTKELAESIVAQVKL